MCHGVFCGSSTNSFHLKALPRVTEWTAKRPLRAAAAGSRQALGAWVNTGQHNQHKRYIGLCKAAVGHLATSQHSVPALWATTAVTLRIEVAEVNPMACRRNADCGRKEDEDVEWNKTEEEWAKENVRWKWKDRSRVRERDEKELTKDQKA